MSTASRSGSGEETTSANVVRNPPASVSGSCIVRSSGTNRIGRRIATGSSDRNLPRAASRLYCRQCDNGEFVQGRVADFSRRRDSNGCQARTGRMQRGRRTATISCPASPQRTRSRVPKTRQFRHDVPRLSSISRCLGPTHVRTPFHHLLGESHRHRSLGAGPITASRRAIHSLGIGLLMVRR
jgi:hypothetical protein